MTEWPDDLTDEFLTEWAQREARITARARELWNERYPTVYFHGTGWCVEERLFLFRARLQIRMEERVDAAK